MREIKFRAWHQGKMTYYHSFNINIGGEVYYLDTSGEWQQDEDKHVIIMQYTGMKDRQGNEIYEGDILKVMEEFDTERWAIVKWGGDYPAFTLSPVIEDEEYNSLQYACFEASCRVVGNIYQNPELLKP